MKALLTAILLFQSVATGYASETRLKELITLEGVRDNQLMGYGLVVGAPGDGRYAANPCSA